MFFNSFLQDVRVGLRVLFKEKTFCILAVLVLALGICGVTTQFAIVNGAVLRGFSFPNPEQLVSIGLLDPQADQNQNNNGAGFIPSAQDYEDIRAGQQSFAMLAGYLSGSTINVTYKDEPPRYTGGYVTEDFFRIIGVSPVLGREFTADDNRPGAEKVTLLSDEIWQRDFGGDPNIVGQAIRINGKPATIIGVMPKNFKFPHLGAALGAVVQRISGEAARRPGPTASQSWASQTGRKHRPGEPGVRGARTPPVEGISEDERRSSLRRRCSRC